ncbi:MAG: hypothetical protein LBM98_07340 [Oscillospiraceae bacterium]|nr:hypothetical protein [Oscillospiraceae bacterium]
MPRAYTPYVSQVRRRSQRRRTAPGRGTGEGGFETRPYKPLRNLPPNMFGLDNDVLIGYNKGTSIDIIYLYSYTINNVCYYRLVLRGI